MDLVDLLNEFSPFGSLLGIEITAAADGAAAGTLTYSPDLCSTPDGEVLHGGATFVLADSVGGAAVVSQSLDISPTVDMRIDYLAPATTDLHCEAEVIRSGENLAMVRADVFDAADELVATAHGTYKTGGQGDETPWGQEPPTTPE